MEPVINGSCASQVRPKLAASSVDQVLSICQSLTTLGHLPGPGWHTALVSSARSSPLPLTAEMLEQLLLCSAAMQAPLPDDLLQVSCHEQTHEANARTIIRFQMIVLVFCVCKWCAVLIELHMCSVDFN